jgi:hypothetical protein
MTAYSLFWWSASQQKIVFGLHWNIWWLPTVCFGGQRLHKKSCFVFTEIYDDCLQSVLVVSVSTKDRILSSLKHMTTAYSLFWWSASQQKIVSGLHWNIWWLPTVCYCRQSSYVSVKTKHDLLLRRWPPKQTVGSHHMFQWRPNTIICCDADHQNRL